MPYIESFEEFRMRPTGGGNTDWVRAPSSGILVFQNGARSNGDLQHKDPPADAAECAKVRKTYLMVKLKSEIEKFRDYRANVSHQLEMARRYHNVPEPGDEVVATLDAGERRIERLREQLREVEAILDDGREAEERRQREKEYDARLGRLAELDNLVRAFKV